MLDRSFLIVGNMLQPWDHLEQSLPSKSCKLIAGHFQVLLQLPRIDSSDLFEICSKYLRIPRLLGTAITTLKVVFLNKESPFFNAECI